MKNSILTAVIIVSAVILAAGCQPPGKPAISFFSDAARLSSTDSLAIVELYNLSGYSDVEKRLTDELYHAVLKKQIFSVRLIKQNDAVWKNIGYDYGSDFSLQQLYTMQETVVSDAVLIGTVTDFQPYPHLSIALSLEIISLEDGRRIWAAQQVWDSADKDLEKRVERYIESRMRSGLSAGKDSLTFVSSRDFMKFLCYELAETMERR